MEVTYLLLVLWIMTIPETDTFYFGTPTSVTSQSFRIAFCSGFYSNDVIAGDQKLFSGK